MIKDILLQIKYTILFNFQKKKGINERLKEAFGKIKDASFNRNNIERYFRNKDNAAVYQVLSDKTCNDLYFGELFQFLDRTNSKVGQQYIYNKLKSIHIDKKQIALDEEIIVELTKNTELRISIQKELEKLNSKYAHYIATLFQNEHVIRPKWYFIIPLLAVTSLVTLIGSFYKPQLFILLIVLFCVNFIIHYWNKNNLVQYVSSIPQLIKLNNVTSHLWVSPLLKTINPNLSRSIQVIKKS